MALCGRSTLQSLRQAPNFSAMPSRPTKLVSSVGLARTCEALHDRGGREIWDQLLNCSD